MVRSSFFVATTLISSMVAFAEIPQADLNQAGKESVLWFNDSSKPLPKLSYQSAQEANEGRNIVITAYRQYVKQQNWDKDLLPMPNPAQPDTKTAGYIPAQNEKMPYVLLAKGEAGKKGWPLIIAMHGGGQDPQGQFNNREWDAQKQLFGMYYPNGMYIIPRIPNDNHGRWYYDYCQEMVDKMIRRAIWTRNVDPDRVYITGISEGGYAAYRFPAHTPERFAAADAMAAAESFETAPPENLHTLAFRCDIGEHDNGYGRDKLVRNYKTKLAELAKQNPGQYTHEIAIQPGRGHGIDYKPGPLWMINHVRKTRPTKINWTAFKMHNTFYPYHYWLVLDKIPDALPISIQGEIKNNVIVLTAKNKEGKPVKGIPFRVYLDDQLVNLDEPVTVIVNGKKVFNSKVSRSMAAQVKSLSERSDPGFIFPAMLKLTF